ncbi:MAG TPA: hypothetical protein VF377_01140 [Acidimicrobiia bacterium]
MTESQTQVKLWSPPAPDDCENPFDEIPPKKTDKYVVVDEIDGTQVRLVVSPWPLVEPDGHLVFPIRQSRRRKTLDDPTDAELMVEYGVLHQKASEHRSRYEQLAADRPLRVGDVFWFRGELDPELAGQLIDVTYGARAEAKAAMSWAVAGSLDAPPDLITTGAELAADEIRPELEQAASVEQQAARPSAPGAVARPSI